MVVFSEINVVNIRTPPNFQKSTNLASDGEIPEGEEEDEAPAALEGAEGVAGLAEGDPEDRVRVPHLDGNAFGHLRLEGHGVSFFK